MTQDLRAAAPTPPVAKRVPREITQHGETRTDQYFWLRDRDNPETIAYLEAENRYTEAVMADTQQLQKQLYGEMLGHIQQTDATAPVPRDGFLYYSRTLEGKQYSIHCRRPNTPGAAEQVLLDLNELAKGQPYLRLGNFAVSPDQKQLAYALDTSGDEVYVARVKDLTTGALLPDEIPNTYYGLEWTNDGKHLVYITLDAAKRPYRAWRHALGSSGPDELLYEEKDERFHLSVDKSRSRRFLFLKLFSHSTSEVHYLDAADPRAKPVLFAPRKQDVEYDLDHQGDRFLIRTTEGGRNYRVLTTPIHKPTRENWTEYLPHRESVMVEGIDAFSRYIVIHERENGLPRLHVRPIEGAPYTIPMPEPVYTLAPAFNLEYETDEFRYEYTSLVTPKSTFTYNMVKRETRLVKQQPVPNYQPARFETRRIFATSHDGVQVPISLVMKKGLKLDGRNPTLLYGYGSYGVTTDPNFSSERLCLLDRGWVFAIAHIRGGADLGKPWHDAGKMKRKRNTFEDFIAAAKHLIAEKFTASNRLAILGGSAGGLLMGAVINMRPDLFHAVIAKVPFVDVLNTATDPSLPLTVIEYDEWGNSNYKDYWEYIKSYSPYDNIERQVYPHLLVTAGLNDPRVSYWEPAKWVAKLRTLKKGGNLLLLRTNMDAGHGGASGRYERLKEIAIDYAFLLKVTK